jgi:hypothetical protein
VKSTQEPTLLVASDTSIKSRERAGAAEMPRLAAFAGQIIEARKPGEILELRAFRPKDIVSDRLVERALRTSADYVASYVIAVARADPERARALAEEIEVPWVRPVERPGGRSKSVVEVVKLSEYLTRNALVIGEQAAQTGVRRLVKKKR